MSTFDFLLNSCSTSEKKIDVERFAHNFPIDFLLFSGRPSPFSPNPDVGLPLAQFWLEFDMTSEGSLDVDNPSAAELNFCPGLNSWS